MTIAASDGLKLFIPQVYDIVWSLIILVIVALFFHKFFMPKFNAIFDERAAKIEGNIAKAEQSKKDADAAKSKYEAQLSTARVEASKIRDDARAEASHIIADARSRAESDAAQITANAQRSIESQQQALVSLKGEVGTLATALAGKILGAKLESDDVQSSMIDKMIDDLDTNDKK
ncbi:F0F1 ATP synthase subunit B [Bifidobacterium bifidum]|uniref:F0F1 ATP synthase subunit B n=1 Tax=Bifidobacterium bifidum TaxID=1681 RepID=UPI00028686C0|nr:F0F1 ATP synthase subunit B [Bifidobacterium bifidum]EKE50127.1 F0F1 ATP synthase subunit B [Bifidobacterium bifidum LMG 13195]MDG5947338.1 F0F1 ATP synthase subunit B [Bifidobacterium bifidum]MDG5965930.1 F0F1 ATP synthase subunit B [Bifidobacterium bifidum]